MTLSRTKTPLLVRTLPTASNNSSVAMIASKTHAMAPMQHQRRLWQHCRVFGGSSPSAPRFRARTPQASSREAAAAAAVDDFVESNSVVAFGTGELVNHAIAYLGSCLMNGKLENVKAVPAGSTAAHSAAFYGVPLTTLEEADKVDVLIDQIDQYDAAANAGLKGIRAEPQQPELPRLQRALAAAGKVVLLAEAQDLVPRLSASLPVVIEAADWETPAEALDDLWLGDAEIWRRPAAGTANPRGGSNPYVSDEGHGIVDVRFYEGMKLLGLDAPYEDIVRELQQIDGVVTHGLLLNVADAVLVADPAKGVVQLSPKSSVASPST